MESVVEDVEDQGETEGGPANSQYDEDSGGWDDMRMSISVNHGDGLFGLYQGHHRQTSIVYVNIVLEIFEAALT